MQVGFMSSFKFQIEILPRLTVLYGKGDRIVSFEWLFWSLFFDFNI